MVDCLNNTPQHQQNNCNAQSNNVIKINVSTPYRKLTIIKYDEIVHHTYQIRQQREYRIVIRHFHHLVPEQEIKERRGHKFHHILNITHRKTEDHCFLPIQSFERTLKVLMTSNT